MTCAEHGVCPSSNRHAFLLQYVCSTHVYNSLNVHVLVNACTFRQPGFLPVGDSLRFLYDRFSYKR